MKSSSNVIDKLRDPGEKTAFAWLAVLSIPMLIFVVVCIVSSYGVALLFVGLIVLIRYLVELFAAAYIKTNAVQVSENQLPEIHAAAVMCCEKLGVSMPVIYVLQENVWNAFAMQLANKRIVVLLSGAIDSLLLKGNMQQVTFIVGHEIGHHAAGHLDTWKRLVESFAVAIWIILWYRRRCELTCDRIGLYCTGDVESSIRALANLTVGAQLAEKLNINEAIAQWYRHSGEVYVKYRTIYSTHPPLLWRLDELAKSAITMGMYGNQVVNSNPVEPTIVNP